MNTSTVPTPGTTPQFLRITEVTALTTLQQTALYARIKQGTFPPPRRLSARCSVWLASEVHAWMLSRPASVGERPGSAAL